MDGEPHRSFDFGPQLITLLGVLVGAVVVVSYQCLANGCCCNQRRRIRNNAQQTEQQQQPLQINPNVHRPRGATTATTATTTTTSDNENEVSASPAHQLMPNFKYSKECKKGICAVCLCEFKDGETIRVLPECMHFFHVGCIDTWLHLHSNCPLCRTDIVPPQPPQRHVVISMPNFSGIIQP